jgi:hypothetical protein
LGAFADLPKASYEDIRQALQTAVEQLDHVLPGQAPILHFVHHNTLHGYQHLPFPQALEAAEKLTGIHGYLPETEFRALYAQGRITGRDLDAALAGKFAGHDGEPVPLGGRGIGRREVARIALLFGADAIEPNRFNWQVEEMGALRRFQADLPKSCREALLGRAASEEDAVQALWNACLDVFGLEHYRLHPEDLTEIPLREAGAILAQFDAGAGDSLACPVNPGIQADVRAESQLELSALLAALGKGMSLRGLLAALTGVDVLEQIRPLLVRFCASQLDEGLAAWRPPERADGLYTAWKRCAAGDPALGHGDPAAWQAALAELPEQSADAVIALLRHMEIPPARWKDYLERLALELPGWAGLINWRARHPEYAANRQVPVTLMDFLAIRLFLDRLFLDRLCRETWGLPGKLSALQAYFEQYAAEFLARKALFAGELPEYLANTARKLTGLSQAERSHPAEWHGLAEMVWAWRRSPAAERSAAHTVYRSAWRLFRLSQHLGLAAADLRGLALEEAERLLRLLDGLSPCEKGHLWLLAYEHHYREQLFAALSQNHGRGRWARREARPQAQVVFCMDDREESLRRHLEELNPDIETLGAAGFFGVAMNWRGLDDAGVTPLCPVVVTPAHEIREQPQPGQEALRGLHDRRRRWKAWLERTLNQEIRRNLATSGLLIGLLAPGALPVLAAKVFFPRHWDRLKRKAVEAWVPAVPTRLALNAPADAPPASSARPRLGLTDVEQAERVEGFLRTIGLASGFAPLVAVVGHGSISQNNPHLAAYDCGACSGRHGGPNARAFAAMANRPEVRAKLAQRGMAIPDDTWFLGAEHNTCDDGLTWFDLDAMPAAFQPALEALRGDLLQALAQSAHERCRRFASAPRRPGLKQAVAHVLGRSADFSQARPELGHATNAAALIGRRSATRGAFFDRRLFLISYDPTQDPEGKILESILLAAGPVGAGINLEYYFSTVNNERYGCGSKVPHNVAGLFGVMEGTSSDLRTGLPRQMVEIHEAMRLQLVCEAREEVLAGIYRRQPILRELVGNGWLLLSALHPDTGALSAFEPGRGFVAWAGGAEPLPVAERSVDWYADHSDPRPPALLRYPDHPPGGCHVA